MRILITGSTGMVGKNFLENAEAANYNILAPSSSSLDLRSYASVVEYLRIHKPELIIHAAGRVGGIQANIANPVKFLIENMDMGKNIVMAAYETGIKQLLNLGSSCMYPRAAANPLEESSILQGELEPTNEGYALAKITTARLCEYINREDPSCLYRTLIPCNLYGRWDKFDPERSHLIPAVIKKIDEAKRTGKENIEIWGDGTARREFMYCSDFTDFLYFAIDKWNELPSIMNVGLGYDYSIKQYYQQIAEMIDYSGTFTFDLSKPAGMKQKLVNIDKQNLLGWKPSYSLAEGIKKTYEFYIQQGGNA